MKHWVAQHCPYLKQGLPPHEAEWLVQEVLFRQTGKRLSRFELYAAASPFSLSPDSERCLQEWFQRRLQGEPLQYLLGQQPFHNHVYQVRPGVFIPRPETEILVRTALQFFQQKTPPTLGLELGLGSGVLSIELLSAFDSLEMLASEVSPIAQAQATENAHTLLGVPASQRLQVLQANPKEPPLDLFLSHLSQTGSFSEPRLADFLISNPPYLDRLTDEIASDVLLYEPPEALFAESPNVSFFYEVIAQKAPLLLRPHAPLFLEVPHPRATALLVLFEKNPFFYQSELIHDLTGRPRVLFTQRRGAH